jgi:formylglycine-generating enzyme required for sulfatase activity
MKQCCDMKTLFACAAMAVALFGPLSCRKHPSEEQGQSIYDKMVQNLVFVEGGNFMMGDGGAEFTDEHGRTFNSYWTGDRDTKPAHKVTLVAQ